MRSSKRLLAMLSAGLACATVLAACSGGDNSAGGDSSAVPTNADQVNATIDTSKVK
jgi:ABC-type glycerol-3-phosphate transport system substrate-binding protein